MTFFIAMAVQILIKYKVFRDCVPLRVCAAPKPNQTQKGCHPRPPNDMFNHQTLPFTGNMVLMGPGEATGMRLSPSAMTLVPPNESPEMPNDPIANHSGALQYHLNEILRSHSEMGRQYEDLRRQKDGFATQLLRHQADAVSLGHQNGQLISKIQELMAGSEAEHLRRQNEDLQRELDTATLALREVRGKMARKLTDEARKLKRAREELKTVNAENKGLKSQLAALYDLIGAAQNNMV